MADEKNELNIEIPLSIDSNITVIISDYNVLINIAL